MCGEDMYVFASDGDEEEEVSSLVGVIFGEEMCYEWNQ